MIAQHIRAEPGYIGNLVCEVGVMRLTILSEVSLGHDRDEHRLEPRVRQRLHALHALELPMKAKNRGLANVQMEIRRGLIDESSQELVYLRSRDDGPRVRFNAVAAGCRCGIRSSGGQRLQAGGITTG